MRKLLLYFVPSGAPLCEGGHVNCIFARTIILKEEIT